MKTIPAAISAALLTLAVSFTGTSVSASDTASAVEQAETPVFDPQLAQALGADDHGMRRYVLVVLKTGPSPVPAGAQRDAMFKGHFANIKRLAEQKKLALAGPFDGADGWRGLFILAVADIAEAETLVVSDPVVSSGEMIAEYHIYYGSAALMTVNETHARIARKTM